MPIKQKKTEKWKMKVNDAAQRERWWIGTPLSKTIIAPATTTNLLNNYWTTTSIFKLRWVLWLVVGQDWEEGTSCHLRWISFFAIYNSAPSKCWFLDLSLVDCFLCSLISCCSSYNWLSNVFVAVSLRSIIILYHTRRKTTSTPHILSGIITR